MLNSFRRYKLKKLPYLMEIASCGLYLQPITNGALEEKFVREFFCPYFIVSLHAITEHGEVVLKGVFAANLLPDGIHRVRELFCSNPKNSKIMFEICQDVFSCRRTTL